MWLTEQREVDGPAVYGYLRLGQFSPERHAALTITIAQFCHEHELTLCGIFVERDGGQESGFAGLLDVLTLSGAYGVVLPTPQHLGHIRDIQRRRKQISEVGARLLYVRGAMRNITEASSTHRSRPAELSEMAGSAPRPRSPARFRPRTR